MRPVTSSSSATPHFNLSLPSHAVFSLHDAHDVEIHCRAGTVWVTFEHDRRDVVLAAGERYRGDGHRGALVEALGPACVRLSGKDLGVAQAPVRRAARSASAWGRWPLGAAPA